MHRSWCRCTLELEPRTKNVEVFGHLRGFAPEGVVLHEEHVLDLLPRLEELVENEGAEARRPWGVVCATETDGLVEANQISVSGEHRGAHNEARFVGVKHGHKPDSTVSSKLWLRRERAHVGESYCIWVCISKLIC